ncbi:aminotransferase class III-fold pyridoxal phosphate-dependent enzyme, partial [Aquitalea sp. S1-19]|nr:aminotransferase class III-fold pyridoxal phosphate-dependent enzyme [Aquitalea sp. S1-19]
MTRNKEWLQRSRAAVWHPCTQMKRHETLPIVPIARGDGAYLVDFDGQRYLDGVSSWWVNLFGHNEARIKAAIRSQLDELDHVMLAGFTHRPVVELSERLSALTGLGHAFYASDGASATEIALKMSFHYWKNQGRVQKQRFVSLENSYHGETAGALAVLDIFEQDDVLARNREQALRFDALLVPLQQHPRVRHWRRCGMIWAFEVDSARADFAQAFFAAMLKLGCLLRPIGKTVYFMPPYVVTEEDMTLLRDATLATLELLEQDAGA